MTAAHGTGAHAAGPAGGPRLALWAGASLDNLGDRLLARVTEAELVRRLPGARVRHFCPWSRSQDPEPLWIDAHGRWPGTGRFDAVVLAGGGVFGGPPFKHPLMQVFCLGQDPARFDPGVPVFWHGVGLQDGTAPPAPDGASDISGDYLRALARRVGMLAVRDRGAVARFAAAGVQARLVPDPVFALAPMLPQATRQGPAWPAAGRRPRIGVAVGAPHPTPRLVAR
ncbi:MAG: polysaccharide pyruvyl transferase family protein, partial [Actinocrinis sp.]